MLDWEGDQITLFATQMDDSLIIEGLSNLAMKPNESMGKLLPRITNSMGIIKDSYVAYQNKVWRRSHESRRKTNLTMRMKMMLLPSRT
jgi:hypothetical protein